MAKRRFVHWHSALLVVLIAAIVADIAFGLDSLLNLISTLVMVGSMLLVTLIFAVAALLMLWISARNLIQDIEDDSRSSVAWRWRILALAGGVGILVDGAVGAWNAYQKHILFSTAVEGIPFSGIPVFLLLASYPLRWIEQYLEIRTRRSLFASKDKSG